MEDVFIKMADCGSGSVGTCLSSLFIMKHNCLENLGHNVFSDESSDLSSSKCLTLEEKEYFSSSVKLDPSDVTVLSACKNSPDSADHTISSLDSTLEDTDNYKKKRCMDRYDSSESSDSGVLTGSTCSESSSNSGNSDITDPCSPYSVTSFHLGDDSVLSSTLPSKSLTFSNNELENSKMLPDNLPREEEHEVSCWAWDKTIEWNDRYELTSDDIDVCKNTDLLNISSVSPEPNLPVLDETKNYLVFPKKHINKFQLPIYDENCSEKPDEFEDSSFDGNETTITASKSNADTTKFILNNNYPLDFFNILPSVFTNPILNSIDDDEFEKDKPVTKDDCFPGNVSSTEEQAVKDFCCKSKLCDDSISNVNNNNVVVLSSGCLKTNGIVKNNHLDVEKENETSKIVDSISVYKENIRFPSDKRSSFLSERICRWAECVDHISSTAKLIEHLQTKHVNPQTFSETFICLWNGCKVFGRPSCSRTWLERHVLSHGGNKPFRCIVDNCGQRFSSRLVLERHINQHFKVPKDLNDGVVDATPKLIRRNGQKLRYRRQPYSARGRTDAFDIGTMANLQYLLVQMAQRSKSVSMNVMDSRTFLHITFQPKVIGCRQEQGGEMKYLIRWYPYNALEDEWLPKSEVENVRNVPIWKLPASVQQLFWESIFPNQRPKSVHQSRKYKPECRDT